VIIVRDLSKARSRRLRYGEASVWARDASASVRLDGVGGVTLFPGGIASLTTSVGDYTGAEGASILIIVVQAGEVAISLESGASARVEVSGSHFRASPGSRFGVRVVDGEGVFSVGRGEITPEAQGPDVTYLLKSVRTDNSGKPIGLGKEQFEVHPNKRIPLPIGVQKPSLEKPKSTAFLMAARFMQNQPSQTHQPAIDLEVEFCLRGGPVGIGVFLPSTQSCEIVKTNQYGVAIATFQAGPNPGSAKVRATAVASKQSYWEGDIRVVKPFGVLKWIVIGAAAIGGTVCAFKCDRDGKGPVRPLPPQTNP
jgi:hypothetical protein